MMTKFLPHVFGCVSLIALAASAIYANARYLLANTGNATISSPYAMGAAIGSSIFFLLVGIVAIESLLRTLRKSQK